MSDQTMELVRNWAMRETINNLRQDIMEEFPYVGT